MLGDTSSEKFQALLHKATNARECALKATRLEDQEFWFGVEKKWIEIVCNSQHIERINDFLLSIPRYRLERSLKDRGIDGK
jgi:predicted ATP-grasp superfamily ATP-dependent carboligase